MGTARICPGQYIYIVCQPWLVHRYIGTSRSSLGPSLYIYVCMYKDDVSNDVSNDGCWLGEMNKMSEWGGGGSGFCGGLWSV